MRTLPGELALQLLTQVARIGLKPGTGVMGNQVGDPLVGVGRIPQVAGAVQRMEARLGQVRRVADVVQDRRRLQQVCVLVDNEGDRTCPLGNS